MNEFYERHEPDLDDYDPGPGPADDPAVRELEPLLLAMFNSKPNEVFYESQLVVLSKMRFFHWVTSRVLKESREANQVGSELQKLSTGVPLRFYFNGRNRYWKRRGGRHP
jgi:hypothetical protein